MSASAAASVSGAWPIIEAIQRRPDHQVDRGFGVDVAAHLAAGDAPIPDRPEQFASRVHQIRAEFLLDQRVGLGLADELREDASARPGVEVHQPAQHRGEIVTRRTGIRDLRDSAIISDRNASMATAYLLGHHL